MKKPYWSYGRCGAIALALLFFLPLAAWGADASNPGDRVQTFDGTPGVPSHHSTEIRYISTPDAKFFVHVPANYKGDEPFGVLVFVYAVDTFTELPAEWGPVLEKHKLLLIAPQDAGNGKPNGRRYGLAVAAAMNMTANFRTDPNRVYVSGFSGGARVAGQVAFYQSDLFRGTMQMCGADFYKSVPQVHPRLPNTPPGDYGIFGVSSQDVEAARKNVKFAFITGPVDFRHGQIQDIYEGGFAKEQFQAKLIDVPSSGHQISGASALSKALDFIDGPVVDSEPAPLKAKWASEDPSRWPPLLLRNDALLRGNIRANGGCGFLMRLPNGAVVAATAKHVIDEKSSPSQAVGQVVRWTMSSLASPQERVKLGKLALTADADQVSTDCLIMLAELVHPWPVEVLSVRATPVDVGDAVYLVGDPKGVQTVYPCRVLSSQENHQIWYELPPGIETRGFSGAPLLDSDGAVVGIHLGHGTSNGKPSAYGLDLSTMVAFIDAPAPPPAHSSIAPSPTTAKSDDHSGGSPGASDISSADDSTRADKELAMARNYIAAGRNDAARARLEKLIAAYPKTDGAAEAKRLLKQLGHD